jgi:hypothetical protein
MKRLIVLPLVLMFLSIAEIATAGETNTLFIDPTPTYVGDHVFLSGCGYGANKDVSFFVQAPSQMGTLEYFVAITVRMDANGCFNTHDIPFYNGYVPFEPGLWCVQGLYKTGSGVGDYGHHKAIVELDYEVLA